MSVRNIYGNQTAYTLAAARAAKTPTGRVINHDLAHGDHRFDVVVVPNGSTYGQMMIEDDPVCEETQLARQAYFPHTRTFHLPRNPYVPTVFWCPDYDFVYYGDVSGIGTQADGTLVPKKLIELVQGDYFYTYAGPMGPVDVPVVRYTRSTMSPWLVLYHELGHVKQFYADPGGWLRRLGDTADIEAENLRLHENPMCLDADVAVRAHYKHMENGFTLIAANYALPQKRPALRVSLDRQHRIQDDAELARLVRHNTPTGYFQLKTHNWAARNVQAPRSAW